MKKGLALPTYPYLNTCIKDIEGEKWNDVPGFDGAYHVSTYGRIKSLSRWRAAGNKAGGYYTKEKIRKPSVRTKKNKHLNINTYSLGITLKDDGKVSSTSIGRLVYFVFVEQFDLDNTNLNVSYKDFDGRNLSSENLILSNRSKLHERSYKFERAISKWQKNTIPVLQLDLKDNLINTYKSITEASNCSGFNLGAIAECVKGNIFQHKGFKWVRGNETLQLKPEKKKNAAFNEYLWEKIGKPKTSKKNAIPVLNLSAETLPGEDWMPIEGLEESYYISSVGRIKSISRLKGNKVWLKEHILRLVPDGNQNRPASSILVSFKKEGVCYQRSVARLMYYHFVEKFDMADMSLKVRFKDGCFYNLEFENLLLA